MVRQSVSEGKAVATFEEGSDPVRCSFCAKDRTDVSTLVAGDGVFICNECVVLCRAIIDEREGVRS
jgi:late competence protein required for DNA uptake (superfamily II DNA/RNA helicase)